MKLNTWWSWAVVIVLGGIGYLAVAVFVGRLLRDASRRDTYPWAIDYEEREWVEDFRERWRHLNPAYPEVCGLRTEDKKDVCIRPLNHTEPHGWEGTDDA